MVVFFVLLFITAPYGRHVRRGWGPALNRTVAWVLMEAPASLLMLWLFFTGQPSSTSSTAAMVFLALWQLHYLHRAFVFPFRLLGQKKQMPLLVVLMGLCFNLLNGYFNGRYLFSLAPPYPAGWLLDVRFIAGAALFVGGFALNMHSDNVLIRLRRRGSSDGYQIPRGGFFELVSSPNYLGEMVEWWGWALATWSLPGLTFALWTMANLAPRAWANHLWYRRTFADYPKKRRALIPFVI